MVYKAIDRIRKNRMQQVVTDLNNVAYQLPSGNEDAVEKLNYKEINRVIQDLPPAYLAVFNQFVIGGLSHDKIAEKPEISVGTSRSNLFREGKRLQKYYLSKIIFP